MNSNQNGASIFNIANQLTEDANFTYQYDNNGNLTRKTNKVGGALTSYEYDAENKLVRVVSNGTVVNYKYDGLGRRVEKEINDGVTTKVTRYIYDGENILLELDGANNIIARYTHGTVIDEPIIMERGGQSFFYHADGLGSITEITNPSGTLVQRHTYSSFGKIESQLDPNFIQPYTFTAREFDTETKLYFYRARYYEPSVGRFLQEDPIRFSGGINFYVYVGNNPIMFDDPYGLKTQVCCRPIRGGFGWATGYNHCFIAITGSPGNNGVYSLFPQTVYRFVPEGPDVVPMKKGVPERNNRYDAEPYEKGAATCYDVPDADSCKEGKIRANYKDPGPSENFVSKGPNSNTYVRYQLEKAGMTPPPVSNAPGYDYPLPKK